jgi:TonB-linked SusC/RagA family outer membrane protein
MSVPSTCRILSFAAGLALFMAGPVAAQQGTVTGQVINATTLQPVPSAQVVVTGSNLMAMTNREGQYTVRGVTPGEATLRVVSLGYAEVSSEVTIAAGETATLDFELTPSAIILSGLVVTATGDQRRIEVGNSVAHVNAAELVETGSVANMADLLTARAPGVVVVPGTQTGAGTRVRIRGNASLSLSNNPIYVIDGVKVDGSTGSSSVSVGGTTVTRIQDINPEEIESIEVVRGPSAATLYGTDAANGVIVIRTKRGVVGAPQWTYYTEQGFVSDRNDYPDAYRGWTATSTPSNFNQCILTQVASGACQQDSLTVYNLHTDPEATPYGAGYRHQHGLQLRGGTEAIRYFVHGEYESEDGPLKVPEFDRRWLAQNGLSMRPEERRPNGLVRYTARTNLDIQLGDAVDLAVSGGFTQQAIRLPRSDDSGVPGLATNVYGGPGHKFNTNAAGDTLFGYRTVTPREIYRTSTRQDVNRFIGSATANVRPSDWLSTRATLGMDFVGRKETQICRFSECPVSGQDHFGFKRDNRTNMFTHSLDAAATATRAFRADLQGRTTLGVQYTRSTFDRNGTLGRLLPPGATTISSAADQSADESNSETRTAGAYLEQHLAIRDRLFLTAAVRSDRNSAFGADFSTVFYPKFSASWVVSDEDFFPDMTWVDQLRLRSAYGASGVQPTTTAAVEFYAPATHAGESGDEPGLIYSALGNRDLKPERSAELEVGFDGSFFENRLSTEITYYDKQSRDALVSRILPPSIGTGATARFENLGKVRNWGWEALVQLQLLESPTFGWDLALNGARNKNELVSLGGVPPIGAATVRSVEGYPMFGWWNRPLLGWDDADGDGIITFDEVTLGEEAEFLGPSLPIHEVVLLSGFDFLQGRLRLTGQFDYKGGHLIYNNTERIRCQSRNNCRGLLDPDAPFFEQARTVAVRQLGTAQGGGGFMEKGDFIRFREVALSFRAPDAWAQRVGGRTLSAALSARNLGILWTDYSGVDPEAFGTTGNSPSEFQAAGPNTYVSLRLSLGF